MKSGNPDPKSPETRTLEKGRLRPDPTLKGTPMIDSVDQMLNFARGRRNVAQLRDDGDPCPWLPDDPDGEFDPSAMVAYWKAHNDDPAAQKRLVADPWRLWRLARDMAYMLEQNLQEGRDDRHVG